MGKILLDSRFTYQYRPISDYALHSEESRKEFLNESLVFFTRAILKRMKNEWDGQGISLPMSEGCIRIFVPKSRSAVRLKSRKFVSRKLKILHVHGEINPHFSY